MYEVRILAYDEVRWMRRVDGFLMRVDYFARSIGWSYLLGM